jgi:flavin reductase (DIM6/NTAB) family NADH-FMN oxidoreductase RutF
MDATAVSALFAQIDPAVWLITAAAGDRRGGLIATFVSQASIVPELPRVLVGLAKQHHTTGLVEAGGAFAAHLLAEEHVEWVWRFGLHSGRDGDKLGGLAVTVGMTGSPLLSDAAGWLDCRVEATLDTGDRTVYLAEVVDARLWRREPPLTLKRLLHLAPPDKLVRLKELITRDSAVDAEATRAWRQRRRDTP